MCHSSTAGLAGLSGARRRSCDGHGDAGQRVGERARGGPAQRSTSVMWKLCIAVTLSLSLPHGAGAGAAFFDGGESLKIFAKQGSGGAGDIVAGSSCGAQTPPDRFVFPVKCRQTFAGGVQDTLSVECDAISFSVITNQTTAKRPKAAHYQTTGAPELYGITTPETDCALPSTKAQGQVGYEEFNNQICEQNYRQKCGLQDLENFLLVKTIGVCPRPKCQDPGDTRTVGKADCVCEGEIQAGQTLGTCNCLHWQRFSLKPTKYMPIADSAVCFQAVQMFTASQILEERCVYLDMTVAPYSLTVSDTGNHYPPVNLTYATVGQPLTLTVFAEDLNTHQTLSIDLQRSVTSEKPSVELPRQRWLAVGANCASNPSLMSASVKFKCETGVNPPRALWQRRLTYTPLLSEAGMRYEVNFQASDNGVSAAMLSGTNSNFKFQVALPGTACGVDLPSLCSAAPRVLKPAIASITVQVLQVLPIFQAPTPAEGALPHAYPHCPMAMVGIRVWKPKAQLLLSLSFGSTPEDIATGRKYSSPAPYGFASSSVCAQDAKNQHGYSCTRYPTEHPGSAALYGIDLLWTPPLQAAGGTYKVCVVAQDDAPSVATRCFTFEVKRCMYCTDSESLSHVATRFRTNWLQIWSANDPEWVEANKESLAASEVHAWSATDHPHEVERGKLIHLGPVYRTRAEHTFDELAQRFGTTVWALLELNPDLVEFAEDRAPIPMDQEVCVLPGICSATPGMAMDA